MLHNAIERYQLREGIIMKRPSAAIVIASTARFFSVTGVGFAAHHYLITSTSQIKPSVITALRGHTGAKGATGARGATGSTGAAGTSSASDLSVVGGPVDHFESISIPATSTYQ